ncbi:MAG: hypothetical protein JO250_03500 [Armatimonadetes bacterium]|nr:hypothetical protein [Armatimonadota bacterium]
MARSTTIDDDPLCPVALDNMDVEGDFFIDHAVFAGPVALFQSHIGGDLDATGTRFDGTVKQTLQLPKGVSISGTSDPLDPLGLNHCIADVSDCTIGGDLLLTDAVFMGPVNFSQAKIDGDLLAGKAHFLTTGLLYIRSERDLNQYSVSFRRIKVGGSAVFEQAWFLGPVSFEYAAVVCDFNVTQASFSNCHPSKPEAFGTGSFITDLRNLNIGGSALFTNAQMPPAYDLEGMSYNHIIAGDPSSGPLAFIRRAKFSADSYADLEQYFRRRGMTDQADAVFMEQKQQERSQMHRYSPAWWWSGLLYAVSGYGRRPEWALYWSLAFILYGRYLFRNKDEMMLRTDDKKVIFHEYSSFWYSFSLFVPVLDTGGWVPRPCYAFESHLLWWQLLYCRETGLLNLKCLRDEAGWREGWRRYCDCNSGLYQRWRLFYMRLHILAGWVLIPVGIASITGSIK